MGVSHGPLTRSELAAADAGAPRAATWPMPKDYRTALPKIATGNVSSGHDQGRYVYDLYRRTDESGDVIAMDHFSLVGGQAIAFVYVMKKAPGAREWAFGVVTPGAGESKHDLTASASAINVGNDGPCVHCHSEAPNDGLFSVR